VPSSKNQNTPSMTQTITMSQQKKNKL